MSTQCHPTAVKPIFTLSPDAQTFLQNAPFLAGHYPLTANPDNEIPEYTSIYWDTPDYRLLRTGLAVRLDQANGQLQLTIENLAAALDGKLEKWIRRRTQVTEPVTSGEVAMKVKAWPKALRKAVTPVLDRRAKLHPIVVLRHKQALYSVGGASQPDPSLPLAKLSVDWITVWSSAADVTLPSALPEEYANAELRQLHVEFCTATVPEQEALVAWLANQSGLQPAHQPLLEQALLAASKAPGQADTGWQPEMLVADACRLIWREQLMNMLLSEAGVRYSQEREYVHEMRVAIRRMRAAAKLYGHFFPRKAIRPYLAVLRKTGRLLGQVRNLDVTIAKARRPRSGEGQGTKAPKKLVKAWQQQRQVAHQALLQWLDSVEYGDFVTAFQQFCMKLEGDSAVTPTPQQVRHVIPVQIMEGYAAVRCYEALFEAAIPIAYDSLHDLRIACKHLRYNLEFTRHLLGVESEALINRLKALQELLGDLNDAVVAQTLLADAEKDEKAEDYQRAQAQLVAELSARVPAALATLVDLESRTQLGQALARL